MTRRAYICGPMRGIPRWNFDAFDQAQKEAEAQGYIAVSPATLDRALGLDPDDYPNLPDWFDLGAMLLRDLDMIRTVDVLLLLPGWDHSAGGAVEIAFAKALGKDIIEL